MAGTADDEHGFAFRHFLNAGDELFHGNVDGSFDVAVVEFRLSSHVENHKVVAEVIHEFRGLGRGEAAGLGKMPSAGAE